MFVCAENKAEEATVFPKSIDFFSFLQPASAPSDISEILYSPEPIHRVMKARVPL